MSARLSPQCEAETVAARKRIADLLWYSVPSSDDAEAKSITEDLLDKLVEAVRAESATELAAVRAERDEVKDRFDELEALGRELLDHCTAEYGGPGYTHCELPAGHGGQHESAIGNLQRATWGGESR
ncbi:hypothetical protein ACFYO9_37690 [Streptomyces sp. NPDC005863]|uniref:hypothetical protein n=1 Tax=Streptomyces sp. NPDC005863 TaxID=3364735 RepID=UPI0036B24762